MTSKVLMMTTLWGEIFIWIYDQDFIHVRSRCSKIKLLRIIPDFKRHSAESMMIFSYAISLRMVSIKKHYQTSSTWINSTPKWSVKSLMNQVRYLEASKLLKERKCESSLGSCLSDQSLVKDIRVIIELLRKSTHSPKSVFNFSI